MRVEVQVQRAQQMDLFQVIAGREVAARAKAQVRASHSQFLAKVHEEDEQDRDLGVMSYMAAILVH